MSFDSADPKQQPRGCLFITGDVRAGDWSYCQARPRPGSSYCPAHHARCRMPRSREPERRFRGVGRLAFRTTGVG